MCHVSAGKGVISPDGEGERGGGAVTSSHHLAQFAKSPQPVSLSDILSVLSFGPC